MADTHKSLIPIVAKQVCETLFNESSGHDWRHIERVWRNACDIGKAEGADIQHVELAALLHDLDDWKVTGVAPGERPMRAEAIMRDLDLDSEVIDDVCHTIKVMDFKSSLEGQGDLSLEAQVVHDADKLDAVGAVGIARCFVFNGHIARPMFDPDIFPDDEITRAEYTDLTRDKNTGINHFFDKLLRLKGRMLTSRGQTLAGERHDFMVDFLRRFFEEGGYEDWRDHLDRYLDQT